MKHQKKKFAICVRNDGAEDLEIRKICQAQCQALTVCFFRWRKDDESNIKESKPDTCYTCYASDLPRLINSTTELATDKVENVL